MESDNKKKVLSDIIDSVSKKNKHDVMFAENKDFSYTWELRNFRSFHSANLLESIESSIFEIGIENITLKLRLYLNDENFFYISSVVCINFINIHIRFTISIIDKNEKENIIIIESVKKYIYPNDNAFYKRLVEKNFLFDEKNGWLPNGNLIIKCVTCFEQNIVFNNLATFNKEINTLQHRLKEFEHFEKLLDTGKYSDVKLIVEDKEFHVHKCILTMFSPVFTAMFEHNMKEKNDNLVEITDIKYEVMKEVLSYIYTGRVDNLVILAKDILAAADKYEINELKKLCEEMLISTLSNENIEEMSILADRYNANNLKKCVLELMAVAAKNIIETESENSVSESLITEMLMKILASKK